MKVFASSFINFIYPFVFNANAFEKHSTDFDSSIINCGRHKYHTWKNYKLDLSEMLPHVAQQIQPNALKSSVRLWELSKGALNHLAGEHQNWKLYVKKEDPIPFVINSLQLMLVEGGVGFITVNAAPLSAEKGAWLNFLHYFRFVKGQRKTSVYADILMGTALAESLQDSTSAPRGNADALADGSSDESGSGQGSTFINFISALLHTGDRTQSESPREAAAWWEEVFISGQLLPFTALLVDDVSPEQDPYFIYQLRNFFNESQALHPAPEDLRPDHPSLLPYTVRQWFFFSLDGGGFVGFNAPAKETGFFRQTLLEHLREQYFLLYLFTLYQRFALISLSSHVARNWVGRRESQSVSEREESFCYIRDRMMEFTARGFFTQLMQREHHHRVYQKWQDVFQIHSLYEEVRDEVQEMHNYLMMRRTEAEQRTTQRIQWLIGSLGIISIVISFLGMNLRGVTSQDGLAMKTAVLVALEGTLEIGGLFFLLACLIVLISKKWRGR